MITCSVCGSNLIGVGTGTHCPICSKSNYGSIVVKENKIDDYLKEIIEKLDQIIIMMKGGE